MNDGRTVYVAEEHGDVNLPLEQILEGATLRIYQDVSDKGLLSLVLRRGKVTIRATSWIGLIPINEKMAVEVRPRVPVNKLEEILSSVEGFDPVVLSGLRQYGQTSYSNNSFLDLIAIRLLDLITVVANNGLHFEYRKTTQHGPGVVGSILPIETAIKQWTGGNRRIAVSASWQRTIDTAPNRLLKLALARLAQIYGNLHGRANTKPIFRRVAEASLVFERVQTDEAMHFLKHPLLQDGNLMVEPRRGYSDAIRLGKLVLSSSSLSIRESNGHLQLAPILLNMSVVFEKYIRGVLRGISLGDRVAVIDGNVDHSSGYGRRQMYDNVQAPNPPRMTPDIVVSRPSNGRIVVVDVKYKPLSGLPERSDVEQVLAYGLRYGTAYVAIAYPNRKDEDDSVKLVGTVGSVQLWVLRFNLGASDLSNEGKILCESFCAKLLQ
jgi:5-methylcytosine-specific restriction enzyme subunit McrC